MGTPAKAGGATSACAAAASWRAPAARAARKRPHLHDSGEAAPCEAAIASLPVDLLVQVFCHLNQRALRFVLPLVCRHWCGALALRACGACAVPACNLCADVLCRLASRA